ncbi:MAG TPA: hypothetical protein VEW74_09440, partial [Candidatus Nitrosotalea sp.]|nr:hypothetical protein [Candidatus Nitrosotalea sp.]
MKRTINSYHLLYASSGIALGTFALLLSACNGPASSMSPTGVIPQRTHAKPPTGSATPTPIPFTYSTVNDPNSKTNKVTGINQLAKVVGVFGGGSASSVWESYTSQSPYVQFRPTNYPGAQGTYATGLSSNKIIVGYVLTPNGLNGTWGFVKNGGVWTLMQDPNVGANNCAVTELNGINDSKNAVGFYLDSNCTSNAFVENTITEQYTVINPPGATSAYATGINGKGDISGTATINGSTVGYYLQTGTYYTFAYPQATRTEALSLNWQDQVVGDYTDQNGMVHGFVLTYPTHGSGARLWQSVDEPKATGGTVITGINNHDAISGYYIDAQGNT